ncbi:MAG: DNA-directed RNA polymerase subunit beta' [Capsulimonadaceae bacterium]|nr:DNA-directed RNA polymerase subunit beta' [Capsulimonadaceae bacterium]
MADVSTFDKIRIGIASPQEIRAWSYGEVKKPETINYRTFKPERDGLFCERIFGPVKDWECHCGRYKKVKFKGIVCDRCGVEVTRSKVRRERMGHIELAAPVCHIWYLKGVPSPLSLLLDISPRPLEKVLYFASYIVTQVDRARINNEMADFRGHIEAAILDVERQGQEMLEEARGRTAADIKEHETAIEPTEEDPIGVEEWSADDIQYRHKLLDEELRDIENDTAERIQRLREGLQLIDEKVEKKLLLAEDDWSKIDDVLSVLDERLPDRDIRSLVQAGMGGAAVKSLLIEVDLEKLARELRQEIASTQGPKRARAVKRLETTEAFISSKSRPEWMILDAVPVISPELRPMVQLDGGRFATSDLNDLYRRIINRNNRLKKIVEIKAPESIVNHEKRLLQEAVDALIDNGRRQRPVVGSNNRPLKSLSDMLKGKEGRFRKNLLGKRVDYSGRSVIVVGPRLQLHQCGLPKEMAIELFKPFVMKTLVERNYTSNIKTAKRMIDRLKPEVWDALEEVIKEHPVLLNRAPTLHRLGIQAFEPILVDGKAIQIHPLVCHAFNADFDGDQMAVHVPLSVSAQAEARILMLSTKNLFSPANGGPIVSPSKDIVLGSYFVTMKKEGQEPFPEIFSGPNEAILAWETGFVDLHDPIRVRIKDKDSGTTEVRETTVGRLRFSLILPENMRYVNETIGKKQLGKLISKCSQLHGDDRTIRLLDDLKNMGFREATNSGITIAMSDIEVPEERNVIIRRAEEEVKKLNQQYRRGLITGGERKERVLEKWQGAGKDVGAAIVRAIDHFNPVFIMTDSGARGTLGQITQLSGMRGIMSDPFGNMIEDLPVKSNFHEGLSVLEYFVSTHGARKGLADTALRTADAGYLTRRLVDVAQEVIIREDDCGAQTGIYVEAIREGNEIIEPLWERLNGRNALEDIVDPATGEVIVNANQDITEELARQVQDAGIKRVGLRSVFTCEARQGVCAKCYGRDLATSEQVEPGVAVGIIAAQSIGEPGTQLTMRTFHTGGIAQKQLVGVANVRQRRQEALRELHQDISRGIVSLDEDREAGAPAQTPASSDRERVRAVQAVLKVLEDEVGGLLRVVELFEARKPKGQAIVTEFSGTVAEIEQKGLRRVIIHVDQAIREDSSTGLLGETLAEEIKIGDDEPLPAGTEINEKIARKLRETGWPTVKLRRAHLVPYRGQLQIQPGQVVEPGDRLTEGPLDPQKVLELQGVRGIQQYVVREIQRVYKSQGVDINDKHVEVIVRQMLKKRKIKNIGDSRFLPGQVVDKFEFEDENTRIRTMDPPGREAEADWVLLGITEASLATESFLAAASFQKTTRVLTEAAVRGKKDNLVGLKENVIIGRLIPAGTGLPQYRNLDVQLEGLESMRPSSATAVLERPTAVWGDADAEDEPSIDPDGDNAI